MTADRRFRFAEWARAVGETAAAPVGETASILATVCGEMAVTDVPLAPGVNLELLKAGDDDPLEVVVRVPAGKSTRGWDYRPEAMRQIVDQVAKETAAGYLGHQKAENVGDEFPIPVTHWVGAKWDEREKAAYFRGVVDKAAPELKRWIRAGRINSTSIFGVPTLAKGAGGETAVTGYRLLSIDWTPLGRAGMPTAVVAKGEMGEADDRGGPGVTLTELIAKLKELGVSPAKVFGEMGWTLTALLGEMQVDPASLVHELTGERWKALADQLNAFGEMRLALGLPETATPDQVVAAVKAARQAQITGEQAIRQAHIDKLVAEAVPERARRVVGELLRLQVGEGASDEDLKKAIGEISARDDVKVLASTTPGISIRPAAPPDTSGGGTQSPNLRPVRRRI